MGAAGGGILLGDGLEEIPILPVARRERGVVDADLEPKKDASACYVNCADVGNAVLVDGIPAGNAARLRRKANQEIGVPRREVLCAYGHGGCSGDGGWLSF